MQECWISLYWMIVISTFYLAVGLDCLPPGYQISLFEHNGSEIDGALAPTILKGDLDSMVYFEEGKRSRSLFNYNPRFIPNVVTFDASNRPWMLTGVYNETDATEFPYSNFLRGYHGVLLQTLNDTKEWIQYNISEMVLEKYPGVVDGTFYIGVKRNDHIFHDINVGALYLFIMARNVDESYKQLVIQYSAAAGNWSINEITSASVFPWIPQTFQFSSRYVAVYGSSDSIYVGEYERNKETHLFTSVSYSVVYQHPQAGNFWYIHPSTHSGGITSSLTLEDVTYTVFASDTFITNATEIAELPEYKSFPWYDANATGTPHYLMSWNHSEKDSAKARGGPYFLGVTHSSTDSGPDIHNLPLILADRDGKIHIILGSHGRPFVHHQTVSRNNISQWYPPLLVYYNNNFTNSVYNGVETYPAAVFDHNNTLHLVARATFLTGENDWYYRLHHMKFNAASRQWDYGAFFTTPDYKYYSVYYHKITVDLENRIFLRYYYFVKPNGYQSPEDYPTEPEILFSEDGGDSWELATTDVFARGMGLPTSAPTPFPTNQPTISKSPTTMPTPAPSIAPTVAPTNCYTQYEQQIFSLSPVAYWQMEDEEDASVILDYASNFDADVSYGSVSYASSGYSQLGYHALAFDSVALVDIAYNEQLHTHNFSAMLWANVTGQDYNWRTAFSTRQTADYKGFFFYCSNINTWQFWLGTSSSWKGLKSDISCIASSTNWTFLAATYDCSSEIARFFVNGKLEVEASVSYAPSTSVTTRIGNNDYGSLQFYGEIDEIAMFNYTMSAENISSLHSLGVSNFVGCGDTSTTVNPTKLPTGIPTMTPSVQPTTLEPADLPTPTIFSTEQPTITVEPTTVPTTLPTIQPTMSPTRLPTIFPTILPTVQPTISPTTESYMQECVNDDDCGEFQCVCSETRTLRLAKGKKNTNKINKRRKARRLQFGSFGETTAKCYCE